MKANREFDLRVPWRRHLPVALVLLASLVLSIVLVPILHPKRDTGDPDFPDRLYSTTLRFSPASVSPPPAPAPR
jgi:hypothetical protein